MKFPRSKLGLILAVLYILVAMAVICFERTQPYSGNFMQGLFTYLITFPFSLLLDLLFPSLGIDSFYWVRDPLSLTLVATFAVSVLSCAVLVYLFGAFLGAIPKFLKWIFSKK